MNNYTATFYTHLSALVTDKALREHGIASKMSPVPRALSSSCGTCVCYTADDECISLIDDDAEAIFQSTESGYKLIKKYE